MSEDRPHYGTQARTPNPAPFRRRVATAAGGAALAILLLAVLWIAADVLLIVFAGILMAVFLRALSDPLSRHTPLSERLSLTVVILALTGVVAVASIFLAPVTAAQADEMAETIPLALDEMLGFIQGHGWGRWLLDAVEEGGNPDAVMDWLGPVFTGTMTGAVYLLFLFFTGLFLAVNPRLYTRGLVRLVPVPKRERAEQVLQALGQTLKFWLIGRALAMTLVGVSTALLLWLLGVPFAGLLGIVAGLLTFVPYFGPILAAVPITLIALLQGPVQAVLVLGAYTGVQMLEGYVLDPIIMERVVALPPAITLVGQVVLGALLGALGVALATPLTAVGLVMVQMVYVRDVLGDHDPFARTVPHAEV